MDAVGQRTPWVTREIRIFLTVMGLSIMSLAVISAKRDRFS